MYDTNKITLNTLIIIHIIPLIINTNELKISDRNLLSVINSIQWEFFFFNIGHCKKWIITKILVE